MRMTALPSSSSMAQRCLQRRGLPLRRSTRQVTLQAASSLSPSPSTALRQLTGDGLVFPCGEPGAWDEAGVGSPVVRCFLGDEEERWFLWYSGRRNGTISMDLIAPSSGSLGVALSSDGIHWRRSATEVAGTRSASDAGAFLSPNQDWWTFDTAHLSVGDVQVMGSDAVNSGAGVYWCFYCGANYEEAEVPSNLPGASSLQGSSDGKLIAEGFRTRPGLAMSQDGRNWARIEGDHHTGALFDVGETGSFDEHFIAQPQVLEVSPKERRMWYHSWDARKNRFVIGTATSSNGFLWKKQGVAFDTAEHGARPEDHDYLGATAHHVARDIDNRQYVMFYEAVDANNRRSIGLAVSKDSKTWKRCPHPVLQHSEGESSSSSTDSGSSWDGGAVGSPCPVSMSRGQWRLYYGGRPQSQPGPWLGIGLALSDKESGLTFEGVPCTYHRKKLS